VRLNWEVTARSKSLYLAAFADPEAFLKAVDSFSKETPIYLDSELGDGVKGEDIAKGLHAKGFTHLFLATGYDPQFLPDMPWIKNVVGKDPPWA
jgi:hypothetical protein